MNTLDLRGLDLAPRAGLWQHPPGAAPPARGRADPPPRARRYDEPIGVVSLDGELLAPGVKYASVVRTPSWSRGAARAPVASFGASMARDRQAARRQAWARCVRVLHRMRAARAIARALSCPHLAMEGFLALCFKGPEIAWAELLAACHPARPRSARGAIGARRGAARLRADALRVFEIHEHQVGVLVFVADALASAFVLPHPDDYRALHVSLIEDFYGEPLYRYGYLYPELSIAEATIDAARVHTLADLRAALAGVRREWAALRRAARLGRARARAAIRARVHDGSVPPRALRAHAAPRRRESIGRPSSGTTAPSNT